MTNKPGKAQLAVWLPIDTMTRLKALIQAEQSTLTAIVQRPIDHYSPTPAEPQPDALAEITRQLADHAERLTRLESSQQLDTVIAELAQQGLRQSDIATELNQRGYTTATGKPFERGHSKIAKAVKLASSQSSSHQLDITITQAIDNKRDF